MKTQKLFVKRIAPETLDNLKKLIGCRISGLSCEWGRFEIGDKVEFSGYGKVQMDFWNRDEGNLRLDFTFGSPFHGENGSAVFPMEVVSLPKMPLSFWGEVKSKGLDVSNTPYADWRKMTAHLALKERTGEGWETDNVLKVIRVYHFYSEWEDDQTPESHLYDYVAFLDFECMGGRRLILQGSNSHPSFEAHIDSNEALEFHLKLTNGDRGSTYGQPPYRLVHKIC